MDPVATAVTRALDTGVKACVELEGGQVGSVHRVDLPDRRLVAKTGPTPLTVEARMLRHLDDAGLPVPDVEYVSDALLLLEYVPGDGELAPSAERDAGRTLAALHDETADDYGFPVDTLSGPYRKPCEWTEEWPGFFADSRLGVVASAARDEGSLPPALFERVNALRADAHTLLPARPESSLLHGDLWAGNLVVADGEVRAFLDPACSYGHAEVDLAYADWVGFGDAFFEAYADRRPVDPGFRERRRHVYALYPLLEHVRYFDEEPYRVAVRERLAELGY